MHIQFRFANYSFCFTVYIMDSVHLESAEDTTAHKNKIDKADQTHVSLNSRRPKIPILCK